MDKIGFFVIYSRNFRDKLVEIKRSVKWLLGTSRFALQRFFQNKT